MRLQVGLCDAGSTSSVKGLLELPSLFHNLGLEGFSMLLFELFGSFGQQGLDLFVLGVECGSQLLFPSSKFLFMDIKVNLALG